MATKRPVGRPKKYTPSVIKRLSEELPSMFENGESVEEVCVALRMSKQTFYQLIHDNPEFSNAYNEGLMRSEAWWNRLGREGSSGEAAIQPVTWIFNMKNRFGWKDRNEITGRDGESLFAGFASAVSKNLEPDGDDGSS